MDLGVSFSETINLGAVVLGALIALSTIIRIVSTVPTRNENASLKVENESLARQLRECRDEIGDKARRLGELGAEKDKIQQQHARERARAEELAKQLASLPDWPAVMKFTETLLQHVDEKAAERQAGIVEQFARFEASREQNANRRFEALLENQKAMIETLQRIAHS